VIDLFIRNLAQSEINEDHTCAPFADGA